MVPSINDNDFDAKLAERVRLLEARAQQEKTKSQLQAEKPVTAQKVQSYLFNGTRYFTYGQTSMNFLAWMYRQQHIPVGNHNGTTRNGYPRQYAAYQNADIMDIYHMERVYC
ncbi:hypothetical protein GCK72_022120 [Caenorhabditis remanei]|uniref:Uncharacterized protein n=1 Tax=Caenorhabditis remanei TaxID=31234 RepID=A0A6A5FSZ5_CAERE|nr:hypothetical protein GCK72_022120 [Caenorhabditis remanei]KAF1745673.1 hypothetical protein GCK72_022120 [Caenorhabditis remanei]